jgi:hypothetical protein
MRESCRYEVTIDRSPPPPIAAELRELVIGVEAQRAIESWRRVRPADLSELDGVVTAGD